MSGDKLKRVKAVKKWLDKAEDSYSSNKEITGEINLIMAKAEMQRLDEVHPHARLKKWGLRGGALVMAMLLVGGYSWLSHTGEKTKPDPLVPVQVVVNDKAKVEEPQPVVEPQTPPETSVVQTVNASAPEVEAPAPAAPPAAVTQTAAPAAPVLSASEIQSVVGEAGRALRGET